jgi:hypothetical protein
VLGRHQLRVDAPLGGADRGLLLGYRGKFACRRPAPAAAGAVRGGDRRGLAGLIGCEPHGGRGDRVLGGADLR